MDREGLWRLFLETGLPEAYLALRALEKEENRREEAQTAFAFRPSQSRKG